MDVCLFGKALSKLAQHHHVELEDKRTEASAVLERAVTAKDEEIATLKVNPNKEVHQLYTILEPCFRLL